METSLHELLSASAVRQSQAPAFVARGVTTSYAELKARAERFSAGLSELGVARGDRVALVLDGCVEYLVAYYGILMAGAVVVPLCPDTRARALGPPLAHCGASVVILEADNVVHLTQIDPPPRALRHAVVLGERSLETRQGLVLHDFRALEHSNTRPSPVEMPGRALASIVYTSGTTGQPRGVMLSHANLVSNVRAVVKYLELGPQDRVAMVLPFYYVYGNSVLHTHLAAGASVCLAGSMTFPEHVLQSIAGWRCTGLSGVPSTFARLLTAGNLGQHDLSSLRYLTQAGAGMPPSEQLALQRRLPHTRLFVMYGMTEAAARLTYLPPDRLIHKLGSVGIPIPGVEIRIVDPEGRELPRGTEGELCVRGENVMLGYWADPERTAQVLRPEGLRTGDLGRMDDEGFIYLHGRTAEMIKSGAHRISPREIEEVLESMPGIAAAAVVGVPDTLLGDLIVAFVVPVPGVSPTVQQLQRHCHSHLPRFKLPKQVHFVKSLPHTDTGKLRRRELVERWLRERGAGV